MTAPAAASAEPGPESTSQGTGVTDPTDSNPATPQDDTLGDSGVRALARIKSQRDELRTTSAADRAERDALKAELQTFKDKNLSELELAKRDREAATAELLKLKGEAETYRLSDLRKQIALDKGVPAKLVDLLKGADEEEISSTADRLLEVLATYGTTQVRQGLRPDPSQGARGSGTGTTSQQFAAAMESLL